jgi:hypothetical protein
MTEDTREGDSEAQKPAQGESWDERTLLLAELVREAHANRRAVWDEGVGDARHWGAIAGWLRHKLPAEHPLAFRQPAPASEATE